MEEINRINSVKVVMKTLDVSLDDLIGNEELIKLLCNRLSKGTLSKDAVTQLIAPHNTKK